MTQRDYAVEAAFEAELDRLAAASQLSPRDAECLLGALTSLAIGNLLTAQRLIEATRTGGARPGQPPPLPPDVSVESLREGLAAMRVARPMNR